MSLHASTILSRSSAEIQTYISRLSKRYAKHSLVFALSSNADAPGLSKLVKTLTEFSSQTIGCLSSPLPHFEPHALISCSLAVFENSSITPFRSDIPGRASPQVGRWHAFRKKDDSAQTSISEPPPSGDFDWAQVWGNNTQKEGLPSALGELSPHDVNAICYFTDSSPEGLSNSLTAFPHATKLGLIASSTPFITGRPVTLFHNQEIYGSGAVGFALNKAPKLTSRLDFIGLEAISPPMTVGHAEGNLINQLNGDNPARLLLTSIRERGLDVESSAVFKDNDEFYLACIKDGKRTQVFTVTAGDPSRGTIALKSPLAPPEGSLVQFLHRPKSASIQIPPQFLSTTYESSSSSSPLPASAHRTFGFLACPEAPYSPPESTDGGQSHAADETVQIISDTFLASSENGFILSRPETGSDGEGEAAWNCSAPGGLATIEWDASS